MVLIVGIVQSEREAKEITEIVKVMVVEKRIYEIVVKSWIQ